MEEGNALAIIPFAILTGVTSLFLLSFADFLVFRRFAALRYREVFIGKAATSIFAAVAYSASTGAYGVWLARAAQTKLSKTISIITYISLADLTGLCVAATIPLSMPGFDMAGVNRQLLLTICVAAVLFLALLARLGPTMLPKFFGDHQLVSAWTNLSFSIFAQTVLLRALSVSILMYCTWLAMRAFGIDISHLQAIGWLPAIYLTNALPISIGGFGAVQGMWIFAFQRYGIDGSKIIAFQILFLAATAAVLLLRGLPFVAVALKIRKASENIE